MLLNLKKKEDKTDLSAKPGGQNQNQKPSGLGGKNLSNAAQNFNSSGAQAGGLTGNIAAIAEKFKNGDINKDVGKDFVKKKFGVDIDKLSDKDITGPSRFQNPKQSELGDSKIIDSFLS